MPNIFNTRVYVLTIYFRYNSGSYCYAHVKCSPLLVRGCVTNRKNVCPNSNAHEKYAHSEASVTATQDTGRVHVQ